MKHIKLFENFNDIDSICQKFGIEDYTINEDGTIDVHGDVSLSSRGLTKLPIKFRNVSGVFSCSYNQLTTLEGCPQSISGVFYCNDNQLTTLEGGPQSISGVFNCNNNKLTTLEGGPQSISGDFYCNRNPVYVVWNLFRDYSKVEMFNDYDIIRDDKVIILDRLNSFLLDIGEEPVTEVEGYKCI